MICNLPEIPPPRPPAINQKILVKKLLEAFMTFLAFLPLKLWLAAFAELPLAPKPPGPPALNDWALNWRST